MSTFLLYFICTKFNYSVFRKKEFSFFPLWRKSYALVDNTVENVYNFL